MKSKEIELIHIKIPVLTPRQISLIIVLNENKIQHSIQIQKQLNEVRGATDEGWWDKYTIKPTWTPPN